MCETGGPLTFLGGKRDGELNRDTKTGFLQHLTFINKTTTSNFNYLLYNYNKQYNLIMFNY